MPATIARSTGWMFLGYSGRIALQLLTFVVVARALLPEGFGAFVATAAVASFLGYFTELGAYSLVVRDIQRGVSPHVAIGASIGTTALALPIALLALLALKSVLLTQVGWSTVLFIGLGTFFSNRMLAIGRAASVATGDMPRSAALEVVAGGANLCAASVFLSIGGGLEDWAQFSFTSNIIASLTIFAVVVRQYGKPAFEWRPIAQRIVPGLSFSLASTASGATLELDKAFVARLSTLENAGIYGAASRIVVLAYIPLLAYIGAMYPHFFKAGRSGVLETWALSKRVLPICVAYCATASIGLWVAAPLIPMVLGEEYAHAVDAIRLLAPLVILQGVQFPIADALTGAGLQWVRTTLQLAAVAASLSLNIALVPRHGWQGAAVAALLVQGLLLALLLCFVIWRSRLQASARLANQRPDYLGGE